MKAVIYRINPEVNVIDITHQIEPQNIHQAAFVLSTVYKYCPLYSIHLAVVDPGVGTSRRAIILKTPESHFVAPDNGVLSYILADFGSKAEGGQARPGPDLKAYVINRSEYFLDPVSDTFHGRDIFAPIAARLSLGMPAYSLGVETESLIMLPLTQPSADREGITGHVQHIDSFGNLITDIPEKFLANSENITIEIKGRMIAGTGHSYQDSLTRDGNDLVAIIGSSGYLEISLRNGSAANMIKAVTGDPVRVKSKREEL